MTPKIANIPTSQENLKPTYKFMLKTPRAMALNNIMPQFSAQKYAQIQTPKPKTTQTPKYILEMSQNQGQILRPQYLTTTKQTVKTLSTPSYRSLERSQITPKPYMPKFSQTLTIPKMWGAGLSGGGLGGVGGKLKRGRGWWTRAGIAEAKDVMAYLSGVKRRRRRRK